MLVLEGLLPFFSPQAWRQVFERATRMSDGQIRFIGLSSMLAGVLLLSCGAETRRLQAGCRVRAGRMPFSTPVRFSCSLLGSCPSTSPMSCPPRPLASNSFDAACSTGRAAAVSNWSSRRCWSTWSRCCRAPVASWT
jgi:uncharacterized protein YjeT (DUF2065 family)